MCDPSHLNIGATVTAAELILRSVDDGLAHGLMGLPKEQLRKSLTAMYGPLGGRLTEIVLRKLASRHRRH